MTSLARSSVCVSRLVALMLPVVLMLPAVGAAATADGVIRLYSHPGDLDASPKYAVSVLDGAEWVDAFVHFDPARTAGSGSGEQRGRTFSWVTFETAGATRVRVRRLDGGFDQTVIRPVRHGITAAQVGEDTVEFVVLPGQKLSVEFDTEIKDPCYDGTHGIPCIMNIMMIFADAWKSSSALDGLPREVVHRVPPGSHETAVPVAGTSETAGKSTLGDAQGKRVVVFEAGVHDLGYWQVPNNVEHIHFEGGSVVFGAIDVLPLGRSPSYDRETVYQVYRNAWRNETLRPAFKITGPGILSGAKLPWHLRKDFSYTAADDWSAHVKLVQLAVENITLEDVTLANSPHWVLTFINDDDERTRGVLDNFKIIGGWTYNNDGLPIPSGNASVIRNAFIHADDDAFKIYNSGGRIQNCVVWQSANGAVFQFGWFPKTCSNVSISDVDVIHFENWYGVHQVNRAVFNYANSRGQGEISRIDFSNIHIGGKVLRLFGFHCGNQRIREISFTNLTCDGMGVGKLGPPGANYFIGDISDWTFHDFVFDGQPVVHPAQAQFEFSEAAGEGFRFLVDGRQADPTDVAPMREVPEDSTPAAHAPRALRAAPGAYDSDASGDLADGLLAYWPGEGNPRDLSGNGRHGSAVGQGKLGYAKGKLGQCFALDNAVAINTGGWDPMADGRMTIACWCCVTRDEYDGIVAKTSNRGKAFALEVKSRSQQLEFSGKGYLQQEGNLALNQWHHIVITMNQATKTAELWVDGVLNRSQANLVLGDFPGAPVLLGAKSLQAQQMGGYLDEVAIWQRVLPAAAIAELYNQGQGRSLRSKDARRTPGS